MEKSKLREWLSAFVEAIIIAVILYFLAWPFLIEGSSMENSFETGDRVFVSRLCAYLNLIDYNDVILCKINYNGNEEIIVKRVIGKPGDRIVIKDKQVYINDLALIEPYIKNPISTDGSVDLILKDDEYYVLGDNRDKSTDSRFFGAIKKSDIEAEVIFRWYPFGDMEFVP
ncbi:MAG: signal peptidase I [Clostridiales bacterium]|nr:signal peptidase I [Clostridiales bacterium]